MQDGLSLWTPSLFPCEHLEVSGWRRYTSPHTGGVSLRTQCLLCGMSQDIRSAGEVNPHDIAAYEPFDETLTPRYLQARWQTFQTDQLRRAASSERRSPRWYRDVYLRSAWWYYRRQRALAEAGGKCERCRARKAIHVHHLTYRRLFREPRTDLLAVCFGCHRLLDQQRRRATPPPPGQLRLLN